MINTWISSYLPTQGEFKNLCFVAVAKRICELWAFVYVTSKQSYVIDFSSLILSLYVVKKGGRRKTYHVMDFSIHGKHNSVSCNSVLHCVCKL